MQPTCDAALPALYFAALTSRQGCFPLPLEQLSSYFLAILGSALAIRPEHTTTMSSSLVRRLSHTTLILALAMIACSDEGASEASETAAGGNPAVANMGGAGGGAAQDDTLDIPAEGGSAPVAGPCQGLACQRVACTEGNRTTISGTVYTPSGQLPLYNVAVFIPNAPLTALTPGPSCNCEISGEPVVSALTDTNGHFELLDVPVGNDIPLVIQIGKWRRTFTLDNVPQCTQTVLPDDLLRLPANHEQGDLPRIALSTGGADALECLVRKLGIDDSEFTGPEGGGAVHLYAGFSGTSHYAPELNEGADFPPAEELWSTAASLGRYDITLLSCEGDPHSSNKSQAAFGAMHDYTSAGGRLFASHHQEVWFQQGPAPMPEIAQFEEKEDIGNLEAEVVTSFPKGQALSEWLFNVGASSEEGSIAIKGAQRTVTSENPAYAQRWIASAAPESVQYLSANTPLGAAPEDQCGRVVLSDIHVSTNLGPSDRSDGATAFPGGCLTSTLSPQEKVLAFMLFDLSACVIPDNQAPLPPAIR